jgi:hypothetical protein
MGKLKGALNQKFKDRIQIMCPRNCQKVRFNLILKKSAKILGSLAQQVINETVVLRDRLVAQQKMVTMEIPRNINTSDVDVEMKDCDDTFIKVEGIMIK